MNNLLIEKPKSDTIALSLAEVIVLLLLPLPFFKLNILYVISALIIMLLSKYLRKEKWTQYGFKPLHRKELLIAIALGISFGFVDNFIIEPLFTKLVGVKPDLSSYENVKGNVMGLIGMLALGWFIGGLFEEFFFRGYLFNRIQSIFHNPILFKVIAISLTSIVFAFAHNYQGIGGITDTFLFAIIMGLLYFYFGRNVWYLIIIHGLYDTVGIFRLYLGL
jgi:membrane protease YdiL (CAAX protease family)